LQERGAPGTKGRNAIPPSGQTRTHIYIANERPSPEGASTDPCRKKPAKGCKKRENSRSSPCV